MIVTVFKVAVVDEEDSLCLPTARTTSSLYLAALPIPLAPLFAALPLFETTFCKLLTALAPPPPHDVSGTSATSTSTGMLSKLTNRLCRFMIGLYLSSKWTSR